ncbi:MAG: hypothetical protein M1829_006551 [Trizodia sp. TS-e1964]|nr:MAG: hypothetical protein M1829_006551 [Trizodia sp. TS-e1964]
MASQNNADSHVSKPIKRMRWATQREPGQSGRRKRHSILERFHKRSGSKASNEKRASGGVDSMDASQPAGPLEEDVEGSENGLEGMEEPGPRRRIFFNTPLPEDARDEDGHPTSHFARNKVRTAKYTPLSFIPKNLWFQFHNLANNYFLFVIILSIFSIFGATNPSLGALPLIFIVVVTGIKDAIEDYRRTVLDNELNNSSVHRLVDWNNVNSAGEDISLWRRIKKATSRLIRKLMAGGRRIWKKQPKHAGTVGDGVDESRQSIETRRTQRNSMLSSRTHRTSYYSMNSHPDDIPLTPVQPESSRDTAGDLKIENSLSAGPSMNRNSHQPPARVYGSLLNPHKTPTGKSRFKKDCWKNVQVGDFLRIYNEDQIPADITILSTSDPDGACYVETKNLDGETNLKVRQALHCGRSVKHALDCERTEFMIESEHPQANLYKYNGAVRWTQQDELNPDDPGKPMVEPISINNLLLRGCSLRNTEWVLGVVVFTGEESKIILNSGITPSKRSRITRDLNWNVIYNFVLLFFMCLASGIVQGVTWGQGHHSLNYFEFGSIGGRPAVDGFITFWTVLILLQNLVPISLYISLEIIKTAQAFFIYSDALMYYEKLDYPCTPKSWNISDDLGQIEYIFSDKTGTLTQNVMEFKKCTINGVPYGEAYTEAQAGMQKRQGIDVEAEATRARAQIEIDRIKMLKESRKLHPNPYLHDEDLTFISPDFVSDLTGASGEAQRKANENFMLALALCHTVISERTPGDPPRIDFKAQSPDEAALVATARDCGFTVLGRSSDGIIVNVLGVEKEYTVLNTLEFNSTRKRMSAIIRMPDDGRIVLFCKGADSVIYSRLIRGEQAELRKSTAEHLEMFAREGLRTLCIAQRELSQEEYEAWSIGHDKAAAAVQDREDKLEHISDIIERDLMLLGGTAIEDRLQDGVPDTISLLGDAGIKLWVLTGDKVETAINIGFSCNLLDNGMDLIVFKIEDESLETAASELNKHLETFGITGSDEELAAAKKNHKPPEPTHAIVIDGDSLKLVLSEELRQKFLLLCKQCKSVLCCRVSPSQKAAVVQLVKVGLDVITLSVGDGANDVAMIQEADVGVGIAGEEGRQAVMSSDYAIGQFRFLQRLVLVHGRWSYRRLGETIANFFYKNMVWTVALFWYQLYNNFDGSYLFDYTYVLLYNLAFSSLPVIFMGILDQDVSDKVSLAVPQLYRRGIERREWTETKFWIYMIDGLYQSLMCFFMPYLLFAPGTFVTHNGTDVNDRLRMGVYVGCAAVIVVNVYTLINTLRWDWLMLLLTAISILLIFFWTGVWSVFTGSSQFYQSGGEVFGQLSFWAVTFLIVIVCLLPRFTAKAIQKIYFPRDVDIIREQIRQGKFKYLDDPMVPAATSKDSSTTASDLSKQTQPATNMATIADDERPFYPPSVSATATTHNPRSQNGSDGTEYTRHRFSMESPLEGPKAFGRTHDRLRQSMDRTRPSIEESGCFTSARGLTRQESSNSIPLGSPNLREGLSPSHTRTSNLHDELS